MSCWKIFERYIYSFPRKNLACCILLTHSKNVTTCTIFVLPPKIVFFDEFYFTFCFGRLIRFILNLTMNEMNHLFFIPCKIDSTRGEFQSYDNKWTTCQRQLFFYVIECNWNNDHKGWWQLFPLSTCLFLEAYCKHKNAGMWITCIFPLLLSDSYRFIEKLSPQLLIKREEWGPFLQSLWFDCSDCSTISS